MKNKWCSRRWRPPRRIDLLAAGFMLLAQWARVPQAAAAVPDWLRAAARAPLPSYPDDTKAVILLDEQVTTVKDNGEIETSYRRALRILRPEGREYGTVGVYFDKETHLTYLKAWSISANGDEYEVKEKDAVETGAFEVALYADTRRKFVRIPAAEAGSVVGYEYVQKHRPKVLQDTWLVQDEIPVRRARFMLQLPKGWEFQSVWMNHAEQKPQAAGENQWVWELENLPAVEHEPAMPAWQAIAGRVGVSYFPPRTDTSAKAKGSWTDIGRWYAELTAGRRQATPEIRQKVIELTSASKTTLEKISALAGFVQRDVRYVAVEIGIGGYQPHAAQDIFLNRYGDCKDKVTLLSTMLREAGIESYYVLTHSSRGIVARNFPSMLNFNHAIVAIRLPGDVDTTSLYAAQPHPQLGRLLFFDPTNSLVPLGYLPWRLQANYGLLVTEGGGELLELPLLPPAVNRLLRAAKLELSPTGTISGSVQEIRWGVPAVELRATLRDAPEAERTKILERFLGDFLGSLVFQGFEAENLESNEPTLILRYRFSARDYAKAAGDLLLVRPRVLGEKQLDLFGEKPRKYPVEFENASVESDRFEITVPAGYAVEEVPPPVEADCGAAAYRSKVEVSANVLRYNRLYTIKSVTVPTDRLDELKKFFHQIAADERNSAVLKRATP
jgi:transglutaminase-like putative cysteine protease